MACGVLVPRPGIKAMPPAVEAWSPNHWTAWESPFMIILDFEGNVSSISSFRMMFTLLVFNILYQGKEDSLLFLIYWVLKIILGIEAFICIYNRNFHSFYDFLPSHFLDLFYCSFVPSLGEFVISALIWGLFFSWSCSLQAVLVVSLGVRRRGNGVRRPYGWLDRLMSRS